MVNTSVPMIVGFLLAVGAVNLLYDVSDVLAIVVGVIIFGIGIFLSIWLPNRIK